MPCLQLSFFLVCPFCLLFFFLLNKRFTIYLPFRKLLRLCIKMTVLSHVPHRAPAPLFSNLVPMKSVEYKRWRICCYSKTLSSYTENSGGATTQSATDNKMLISGRPTWERWCAQGNSQTILRTPKHLNTCRMMMMTRGCFSPEETKIMTQRCLNCILPSLKRISSDSELCGTRRYSRIRIRPLYKSGARGLKLGASYKNGVYVESRHLNQKVNKGRDSRPEFTVIPLLQLMKREITAFS